MAHPLIALQKTKPTRRRAEPRATAERSTSDTMPARGRAWSLAAGLLIAGFLIAYYQTFLSLAAIWLREPDYSHGFLVAPVALFLLWTRRQDVPCLTRSPAWTGLALIVVAAAMRLAGAVLFVDSLDGWSILPWLAGAAWLWGGVSLMKWCLPGISFLIFLSPMPWRVETALSLPLQNVATHLSCWILQCLGQQAIAEGTTILLGDVQLEVARACSGLRMFVGIGALAVGYALFVRRPLWQKILLLVTTVPVSLLANAIRITATGFVHQYLSSDAAAEFNHELAGWLMIPLAAALFAAALWYFNRMFVQVELLPGSELLRSPA